MEKTSLLIMAAGIGSRYGAGIKQLAAVGEHGEIIMDYSIHDALKAGFDEIVFIIRRDLEAEFREVIGKRIEKIAPVTYAFQELDDLPAGFIAPKERKKPWGTGHAVLAARKSIRNPFCVINADDYYGRRGFQDLHAALTEGLTPDRVYMAGFILKNTLSKNGAVTRGLCETDAGGKLMSISETGGLVARPDPPYAAIETDGGSVPLDAETLVSMNLWGFHHDFLDILEREFVTFLETQGEDPKAEYLLPVTVDGAMKRGEVNVKVLPTSDRWLGITYQVDLPEVQAAFREMIAAGEYPSPLIQI